MWNIIQHEFLLPAGVVTGIPHYRRPTDESAGLLHSACKNRNSVPVFFKNIWTFTKPNVDTPHG